MSNAAKNVDILVTNILATKKLSVLHNYFNNVTKLIF